MGSDRGSYIVPSLGPVAVVPSTPFEWKGIERIEFIPSNIVWLNPITIVDNAGITILKNNTCFSSLNVYGSNINIETLTSHSFSYTTNQGFTDSARLDYQGDEIEGGYAMNLVYVGEIVDLQDITTMDIVSDDGMLVIQLRNITIM